MVKGLTPVVVMIDIMIWFFIILNHERQAVHGYVSKGFCARLGADYVELITLEDDPQDGHVWHLVEGVELS